MQTLAEYIPIVWTMLSFLFLAVSVAVVLPARQEYSDTQMDLVALGNRLDGTRIIAESELHTRRNLSLAQLLFGIVQALFLSAGLVALIIPTQPVAEALVRSAVISLALVTAQCVLGAAQFLVLLVTLEQRKSRHGWQEAFNPHGADDVHDEASEEGGEAE